MTEGPNVIIDPGYLSPEQVERYQQEWREEQVPNLAETDIFDNKKNELFEEYGLPVCVFATSGELTTLPMLPKECYALARKKFTGDAAYTGEIITFSAENPERIFLFDLSDNDFGTFSNLDEDDD